MEAPAPTLEPVGGDGYGRVPWTAHHDVPAATRCRRSSCCLRRLARPYPSPPPSGAPAGRGRWPCPNQARCSIGSRTWARWIRASLWRSRICCPTVRGLGMAHGCPNPSTSGLNHGPGRHLPHPALLQDRKPAGPVETGAMATGRMAPAQCRQGEQGERRRTTGRPMWPYQVAEALFCNLLRDGRAWLAKTLARLRGCAARTRFHERRRLAQ